MTSIATVLAGIVLAIAAVLGLVAAQSDPSVPAPPTDEVSYDLGE